VVESAQVIRKAFKRHKGGKAIIAQVLKHFPGYVDEEVEAWNQGLIMEE
jgi:hypothetical protein